MAKKYYAVRKGIQPGICDSWNECKANISGFSGAEYKGFLNTEAVQEWLDGAEEDTAAEMTGADDNYAFVDGSCNPETRTYGYGGFLVAGGKKYPLTGCGSDPDMASMRNVAGEICGAMAAARLAAEMELENLTIFYDYAGIEKWATGEWRTTKTATGMYAMAMRDMQSKIRICRRKVAAHTGIAGNETADALAKQAVGIVLTAKQKEMV